MTPTIMGVLMIEEGESCLVCFSRRNEYGRSYPGLCDTAFIIVCSVSQKYIYEDWNRRKNGSSWSNQMTWIVFLKSIPNSCIVCILPQVDFSLWEMSPLLELHFYCKQCFGEEKKKQAHKGGCTNLSQLDKCNQYTLVWNNWNRSG